MADVNISKYRASVVRDGSKPASPGFVVSEGQDPVNPPGTNNFVPYTGATANVELGEFGVEAGFVTLDTTPTNIPTDQGAIYWDDTRSTAALIMNGTLQHIGQDSFFYVKNSSGSTIPKGTCVGFAGTEGGSGHLLVTPFLANGSVPSTYFMGVTAEAIANGSFGQVMHFGELTGINTSGFTAGALLYASSTVAGAFQTTAPVAPNNIVLVAAAVNSKNNGAIVVRPTLGSNINSDEGVKITSPTTGDLLQLQAGGLWENKTLAQVIGSAYVPSTRTITINGTALDLSVDRSWSVGDMLLNTYQVVTGTKVFGTNRLIMEGEGTAQPTSLSNTQTSNSALTSHNSFGFNGSNDIYFNKGTTANGGIFAFSNTATRTYTLKDASGTLAFTSDIPSLSGYVQGSGSAGQVAYWNGTNSQTGNNNFFWDTSTNRLRVNSSVANSNLTVSGSDNTDIFTVLSGLNSRLHVGTSTSPNNDVYIRSQNNYNLKLGTNTTNYLTIFNSGNVLIQSGGTTTDNGSRLQVSGTATISSTLTAGADVNLQSNESYVNLFSSYVVGLNSRARFRAVGAGGGSGYGGDFRLDTRATNNAWNTDVFVVNSSGNVGIGTSSPSTLLHVNGSGSQLGRIVSTFALSSGFSDVVQILNPNQTGGGLSFNIGKSESTRNLGKMAYVHSSDGSTSNRLSFGFYDADNLLNLTAGGNVLIGTTTDNGARLNLNGSQYIRGGNELRFYRIDNAIYTQLYDAGSTFALDNRNGNGFSFQSAGTPQMTITSSGNVGIGTSSPFARLHVRNSDVLEGTIAIGNDNYPGLIYSNAFTGEFRIDNRSSAGAGYITFYPNGQQNTLGNEAMRIATSRNVLIGTTVDSGAKFRVFGTGVSANIYSDNNTYSLGLGYQGVLHGYIGGISSALYALSSNGGQVFLNSSSVWAAVSDVKRKRNFENYDLGLDAILGLKPKYYHMDFQSDKEQKQVGLIAQEVKEFIPQAFEQNNDFIGLNYNTIIVTMVKAIQELKQEIDTLKN